MYSSTHERVKVYKKVKRFTGKLIESPGKSLTNLFVMNYETKINFACQLSAVPASVLPPSSALALFAAPSMLWLKRLPIL